MPDTFPAHSRAPVAVTSNSGGAILGLFGSPLPPATLTLPIAERCRVALMHACDAAVPWQISGKDDFDRPQTGHEHLYVLPFSSSDEPEHLLDRVLLWARNGLEASTASVIQRLGQRGGWIQLGGQARLRVELLGVGSRAELSQQTPTRVLGPAQSWRSVTSFVAPRFPKHRRGKILDAPEEQLSRLAAAVLGSTPRAISRLGEQDQQWARFSQARLSHPAWPHRPASGWMLHFNQPIAGPVAVGEHAHYGLGRFEAIGDLP